jgi:hypothetical protein
MHTPQGGGWVVVLLVAGAAIAPAPPRSATPGLAFDTTFAPIVGQQITLTAADAATVGPRLDLLLARARTPFVLVGRSDATECDLVARGRRRRGLPGVGPSATGRCHAGRPQGLATGSRSRRR